MILNVSSATKTAFFLSDSWAFLLYRRFDL